MGSPEEFCSITPYLVYAELINIPPHSRNAVGSFSTPHIPSEVISNKTPRETPCTNGFFSCMVGSCLTLANGKWQMAKHMTSCQRSHDMFTSRMQSISVNSAACTSPSTSRMRCTYYEYVTPSRLSLPTPRHEQRAAPARNPCQRNDAIRLRKDRDEWSRRRPREARRRSRRRHVRAILYPLLSPTNLSPSCLHLPSFAPILVFPHPFSPVLLTTTTNSLYRTLPPLTLVRSCVTRQASGLVPVQLLVGLRQLRNDAIRRLLRRRRRRPACRGRRMNARKSCVRSRTDRQLTKGSPTGKPW
jgi:hypothetical protein